MDRHVGMAHYLRHTVDWIYADGCCKSTSQRAYHRRASSLSVRLSRITRHSATNRPSKCEHHAIFNCECHDERKSGSFRIDGRDSNGHFLERSDEARPLRNDCFLFVAWVIRRQVEL